MAERASVYSTVLTPGDDAPQASSMSTQNGNFWSWHGGVENLAHSAKQQPGVLSFV